MTSSSKQNRARARLARLRWVGIRGEFVQVLRFQGLPKHLQAGND